MHEVLNVVKRNNKLHNLSTICETNLLSLINHDGIIITKYKRKGYSILHPKVFASKQGPGRRYWYHGGSAVQPRGWAWNVLVGHFHLLEQL